MTLYVDTAVRVTAGSFSDDECARFMEFLQNAVRASCFNTRLIFRSLSRPRMASPRQIEYVGIGASPELAGNMAAALTDAASLAFRWMPHRVKGVLYYDESRLILLRD